MFRFEGGCGRQLVAEVREIVKSYAEKVSAIPADKFGEVMARLAELEG